MQTINNKIILLFIGLILFPFRNHAQTVTDIDGNTYNIVAINKQYWLKEDLKVIHYSNGDIIPEVVDSIEWSNLSSGAWCYQRNKVNDYGKDYNYFTVIDQRKLCPVGWHVPNLTEINQLIYSSGGGSIAGGRLKDTIRWHWPNVGANNQSGFSAIPGSNRFPEGVFSASSLVAVWWLTDQYNETYAYALSLYADRENSTTGECEKKYGFTIRCLADSSIIQDSIFLQTNEINNLNKIKVYPNPTTDFIYIDNPEEQTFKIQVYNMLGKSMQQSILSERHLHLNICGFSKGIYIIKLTGNGWTVQQKITKQ